MRITHGINHAGFRPPQEGDVGCHHCGDTDSTPRELDQHLHPVLLMAGGHADVDDTQVGAAIPIHHHL